MYPNHTTKRSDLGEEIKALEYTTLMVPYMQMQQKLELNCKMTKELIDRIMKNLVTFKPSDILLSSGVVRYLGQLLQLLYNLKAESKQNEEIIKMARKIKYRVNYLKTPITDNSSFFFQDTAYFWKHTRINRIIIDYLYRNSYYVTAIKLAHNTGIDKLINIKMAVYAHNLELSLDQHKTEKCIVWCAENRRFLKKIKSDLEFKLHLQNFVELVRANKFSKAVKYSRSKLSLFKKKHSNDIQVAMTILAYPQDSKLDCYNHFFGEQRWVDLKQQFKHDYHQFYGLFNRSILELVLPIGLSVFKTTECYNTSKRKNQLCPVCNESMNVLAADLPLSNISQSKLFCRINGKQLDENNVPYMLPNGNVYGETGLKEMSNKFAGYIICPVTKEIYAWDELKRVYVTL